MRNVTHARRGAARASSCARALAPPPMALDDDDDDDDDVLSINLHTRVSGWRPLWYHITRLAGSNNCVAGVYVRGSLRRGRHEHHVTNDNSDQRHQPGPGRLPRVVA